MLMVTKKSNAILKNIDYYINLPWTYTIENDVDENGKHVFVIRVNELPGVVTDNYSIEEGIKDIKTEIMPALFEMYIQDNEEIPEPINETEFQGEIIYRTTPKKHYLIAREAQKRQQSLSQVIDNLIDVALSSSKK